MLYCFVECPDWGVELRERHRLLADIMKFASELGCQFAFPTRTLHLFQEQPGDPVSRIFDAQRTGRQMAAKVAGPLVSEDRRPGGIDFGISPEMADSRDETDTIPWAKILANDVAHMANAGAR